MAIIGELEVVIVTEEVGRVGDGPAGNRCGASDGVEVVHIGGGGGDVAGVPGVFVVNIHANHNTCFAVVGQGAIGQGGRDIHGSLVVVGKVGGVVHAIIRVQAQKI